MGKYTATQAGNCKVKRVTYFSQDEVSYLIILVEDPNGFRHQWIDHDLDDSSSDAEIKAAVEAEMVTREKIVVETAKTETENKSIVDKQVKNL